MDATPFDSHPHVEKLREIEERIKPLLAGHPPELQGAVLADLISLWLAGHAPSIRKEILDGLVGLIHALTPVNEMLLFGPGGHPNKEGVDGAQTYKDFTH